MYREIKPLLDTDGQICHLLSKGIKFEIVTVEDARLYLANNNNYFKIRAYRKNFPKHPDGALKGQYINLDFAMLKDLAIIDMRLRYTVIHMALDIEHFSKVKIIKAIEQDGEDGYQIVQDYMDELKRRDEEKSTSSHNHLLSEIMRNMNNPYCGGIIEKYCGEFPVWAFVEIIPLGSLINFYGFCADRLGDKKLKDEFYLLTTVKELRNAAAHSNCILYDMGAKDKKHELRYCVAKALPNGLVSKSTRDTKMENERMRQLVTLLYTHSRIVSSKGVHEHQKEILYALVERMFTNIEIYKENDLITSNFDFFMKVVDFFFS